MKTMTRAARFAIPLLPLFIPAGLRATPTVSITFPVNLQLSNVYQSQAGSDDVAVKGSVGGPNLRDWTLQYKLSASTSWTVIATGTAPVTNATLGVWSTLDRPDGTFNANGTYDLRFSACDTANQCASTQATDTIANFFLTQSTPTASPEFNASAGQRVTYTSVIPWALSATLSIKNAAGTAVKTASTSSSGATTWVYQWDGMAASSAAQVPDGPYFVVASVTDGTNGLSWDQTAQYRNDYSAYTYVAQPDYDPFNNDPLDITYSFDTGRVTIAVAPPGVGEIQSVCPPPSGFCVLDHKYEESGSHTLHWPGVDGTGVFRSDVGSMAVVTDRATFSKNAVVLFGSKPAINNLSVTRPVVWSGASQTITFETSGPNPIVSRQIRILNQESRTVLRTITTVSCNTFNCGATWDGKADNGMLVAPGAYTITATATDTRGNSVSAQALAFIQY